MKCSLLFIVLFPLVGYGQQCIIKEIKRKPKEEFYKTKDSTIVYPIIITKSQSVNSLINQKIEEELSGYSENTKSIQSILDDLINDGVTDISYTVTFNRNYILSLNINVFSCGAHCTSETKYVNFDLQTGQTITINDLIDNAKIDSLRNIVYKDKIKAINLYKLELLKRMQKKEIDSSDYSFVIDELNNNCANSINLENFSLSNSYLQIADNCDFPTVIRSFEPDYELKYSYNFTKEFISQKFFKLLTQK
jgi:hypothetical protein